MANASEHGNAGVEADEETHKVARHDVANQAVTVAFHTAPQGQQGVQQSVSEQQQRDAQQQRPHRYNHGQHLRFSSMRWF